MAAAVLPWFAEAGLAHFLQVAEPKLEGSLRICSSSFSTLAMTEALVSLLTPFVCFGGATLRRRRV